MMSSLLKIGAIAALLCGCGQVKQSFLSVAAASATKDGFQSLRNDANEPSRLTPSVSGQWKPWFSDCYLFAQRARPELVCRRIGGHAAQPEATQLLQYVRSSLPSGFRENKCGLSFGVAGAYCTSWDTLKPRSALVILSGLPGDGGLFVHVLSIYAPPRV
jgi:hypothetical protein